MPDPVLPQVKLPYPTPQREAAQTSEPTLPPAPSPVSQTSSAADDLADFPLYRAPKPTPPPTPAPPAARIVPGPDLRIEPRPVATMIPDSADVRTPNRPQTYEEMVRALVFPEEFAPYVPPSRPTPAPPRPPAAQAAPAPQPPRPPVVPPVAAPVDDDAPPFHYVRKSVPPAPPAPAPAPAAPPAPTPVFAAPPPQEDPETLQNFIRRPSVPLQPPPRSYEQRPAERPQERDDRTIYRPAASSTQRPAEREDRPTYRPSEPPQRDDRTTYHPIASAPPQAPPPESQSSSWIDIAPPPAPRGEALDPQKRQPDRISAIRDSGPRSFPVTDRSGIRLTPSQRMKLGRPTTNVDKEGNTTYTDYLKDQDKPRS